ncbi:MAG: patatin-like phospholipase family protein [Candidatus Faecivicinus sp.]
MDLKLDNSKNYAVVLEGGGARGAYQVGVWRALDEAGIRYNAVAGSSVGALNGAMMAMHRLQQAEDLWKNIRFSQVMNVDDDMMKNLFDLKLSEINFRELARRALAILKSGGFDIAPLRELLSDVVDEDAIRNSDVDFYIATYSLSDRRELYLLAKDIEPGAIQDMLLASAYYPAFRNEPLGGKRYIDGGVQDVLPLKPLIDHSCKDILAIRVFGFGVERRIEIPGDVHITTIAPTQKLGPVMNFDNELSREQYRLGYFDGKRTLYGLAGQRYYIDPTWNEAEAYERLIALVRRFELYHDQPHSLRDLNEAVLPQLARKVRADGGYQDVLIRCLECMAEAAEIDPFEIMTDSEFEQRVLARAEESHAWVSLML